MSKLLERLYRAVLLDCSARQRPPSLCCFAASFAHVGHPPPGPPIRHAKPRQHNNPSARPARLSQPCTSPNNYNNNLASYLSNTSSGLWEKTKTAQQQHFLPCAARPPLTAPPPATPKVSFRRPSNHTRPSPAWPPHAHVARTDGVKSPTVSYQCRTPGGSALVCPPTCSHHRPQTSNELDSSLSASSLGYPAMLEANVS
jgi:hypothetical protein